MDDKLENLKTDLRSLLLTEKSGISIKRLDQEYREVTGGGIEYDRKKHRSLETFLIEELPDAVRIERYDGETICLAVCSEKQEGIQRLVRQQKSDGKKRTSMRKPLQSHNYTRPASSRPVYAKRFNNNSHNRNYNTKSNFNGNNQNENQSSSHSNNNGYQRRRTLPPSISNSYGTSNGATNGTLNGYIRRSTGTANFQTLPVVVDKVNGTLFDVRAKSGAVSVRTFRPEDQKKEQQEQQPTQQLSTSNNGVRRQAKSGDEKESANRRKPVDENNRVGRTNPYKKRYTDGKPAPKLEFEIRDDESGNYKFELSDYVKENGLPEPQYVSSTHVERGRVIAYFSKVNVGNRSWLIFPVSYRTPEGADNGVAKKALEELRQQTNSTSLSDAPAQATDSLFAKLVQLFVGDQSLFSDALEKDFLAKFAHKLKDNWLDLIENSKAFEVQKIHTGKRTMVTVALSKAYLDGQIELDGDEPKANENDQNVITNGVLNGQEGVTDDCEDEPSDWNDTANDSANRTNVSLNGPKEPSDWDETMSPRVVCNDQREPSDWDETINSQNNTSNNQGDMSNSQSDTLSSQKYTSNSPIDTSPIDTSSQSGFTSSSNEIKLSELTDQMSNSNLKDDEETDEQEESDEDRIRKYSQNLPDQLLLDRENDWPVMVLSVTNRSGIVVRLTEHTEKLDELIAEMQDFYNEKKLGKPVIDLILDRIYAVVFDGAVFRVQAMLCSDRQVGCYFLDDGLFEKVDKSNLREMDERFMQLPFQSFSVQLDGLQGKSDSLFRKYFDEMMRKSNDALCLIARPTSYDPIIVRLFDTSGQEDLDVNEELLASMKDLPGTLASVRLSELPAMLDEEDGHPVIVSMVINPNNFMIASAILHKAEYLRMEKELEQVYSNDEDRIPLTIDMVFPGMYVSVKDENGHWYRARIEEQVSKVVSKFTVILIDVGRIAVVELPNIQPLYSQFYELPMRVNRACLNGVVPIGDSFDINVISYFKRLMDKTEFTAHNVQLCVVDAESYVMLDIKDETGQSVSEELVSAGLAKYLA